MYNENGRSRALLGPKYLAFDTQICLFTIKYPIYKKKDIIYNLGTHRAVVL